MNIDSFIDFLLPTGILRPFLSGLIGRIPIKQLKVTFGDRAYCFFIAMNISGLF